MPNISPDNYLELKAQRDELLETLKELVYLVEGEIELGVGNFDSFTCQPAKAAIARAEGWG